MDPTPNVPHAPAASHAAIPPVKPARRAAKRGKLFYLGVAGVVLGAGCCLLSVVALVVAASMKFKTTPAGSALPDNLRPASSSMAATNPTEIQTWLVRVSGVAADLSTNNDGWNAVSVDGTEAVYDLLGFLGMRGMGEMGIIKANHFAGAGRARGA